MPVDNSQLASCLRRAELYLNEWCLGLVRILRFRMASRIDQHGLFSLGATTAGYAHRKLRVTKRLTSSAE